MMKTFIVAAFAYLSKLGYIGIASSLMIEVIPSEVVLSYAGFLVSQGKITIIGAVIAGTIGGLIAQIFLYLLGSYGGRPLLLRYGKFLLINPKHLEKSEVWFDNYGAGVVFFARFIPVIRHAISIPAGITKMPIIRFTGYTIAAIIPWSFLFIYLGKTLGNNWHQINQVSGSYVKVALVFAVIAIALYFTIKTVRQNKVKM
ncbi:VTT domain-containing protein [Priestia megaterium]|uniref:DedA family protein n=1 Tax=Priestia megaterium TaxID=1404 RepID=UPI003EBB4B1F